MKTIIKKNLSLSILLLLWIAPARCDFGIWPSEISFNHTTGNNIDAVTIQKNKSIITAPEYKVTLYGPNKNEPFAYVKGQSNITIKVKFNTNASNSNFRVKATLISGSGMCSISEFTVNGYDISVGNIFTLTLPCSLPNYVNKWTFTWRWEATILPMNGGSPYTGRPTDTQHSFYTLLAIPKAPMTTPWTEVLDKSCVWAYGKTSEAEVANSITYNFNKNCSFYYGSDASYRYNNQDRTFDLTTFISCINKTKPVNCYGIAKAVVTFCNALGCNLKTREVQPNGVPNPLIKINCVRLIGTTIATNGQVGIKDDCRNEGFGIHCIATSQNNSAVWDACLEYDIDSEPDNVITNNPDCGVIDQSGSNVWYLPLGVNQQTYLSSFVDYWTLWNGTAITCNSANSYCTKFADYNWTIPEGN